MEWSLLVGLHPESLVALMGHSSRQRICETYGTYRRGLKEDRGKIQKYFGKDCKALQN